MSKRYSGALITKTPVVPTSLSAPGIWSLSDQAAAQSTNTWPFPRDPQFKNVTMLLHGDGSAGPVAATGVGAGVSTTVTNFNADASTNNFNVTINGDARSNNFNPYQAGYYSNYFNGSSYFQIASTSVLNMNTYACLECWVLLGSSGTQQLIIGRDSSYWLAYDFSTIGGASTKFVFAIYNGSAWQAVSSSTTPSVGTWYHIVGIKDNTTLRIYINGTQENTATFSGTPATGATPIGIASNQNNTNMTGYISNARFNFGSTSAALPYTANFTPSTTPLTAVTGTQLLTCQSNRFVDNSTNALSIPIAGTPQVSPAIPFTLPTTVATYGSGYLDGSGDYLSVASNTAFDFASDFTVEGYFYFVQINQVATATVLFSTNVLDRFQLATESNIISLRINGTLIFNASYTSANLLNTWTHIAVVRTGSTVAIFVNGVRITTGTSSATSDNSVVYIGIQTPGYSNHYFNGYISSLRVVNGSGPYNATVTTLTVPTAPLTAITNTSVLTTQYNGGGNNSGFKDSSQFNFPITRNGNTTQGTFTPYGSNWSNYFPTASINTSSSGLIAGTNTFTLEFWIFPTAGTSDDTIVDTRTSNGADATAWLVGLTGLSTGDGVLKWLLNGTGNASLGGTVPKNQWSHIAVTRNSSNVITGYVNGVATGTTQTDSRNLTNTNFLVGGNVTTPTGTWYLSNVRWVVGSVVYSSTFTPSTTPLTAITNTKLLTCQSNRYVDNSSNGYTFTQTGSPSVQRFSPFAPLTVYNPTTYGGSLYADGTGDYLVAAYSASNSLNAGDFTVEAWVYKNSNAAYMAVGGTMTSAAPYNTKWQIIGDAGGTKITWSSDAFLITSSATLYTGSWYHVAFVRSSGTLRLYINGVLDGSSADTRNYNSATDLWVAQVPENVSGRNWNGYITNFRINPTTAVYTAAFTPPTAPLTATTGTSFLLATTNPAILDNAMLNNLETVGNAAVSTSVKKYGAASMYFEGSSPYGYLKGNANLSQNVAFGTGDFTVECWVYLTTTASDSTIMDTRPGSNSANYFLFYLWTNGGAQQPTIAWYSPTSYVLSTGTVSSGTWTHIAVSRASGTIRSFKDGVLQQSASDTRSYANPGAPYPYIGAAYGVGVDSFKGYIDDFRITKYARYTANFTVPDQAFPNG